MNEINISNLLEQLESFNNKTYEHLMDSGQLRDTLSRIEALISLRADFKKFFEEKSEYFSNHNNINPENFRLLEQLLTKILGFAHLDIIEKYCINNPSPDMPYDLTEIRQVIQETGLSLDDIRNFKRKINITRKLNLAKNFSLTNITDEISPFFEQPHFGTKQNVDFQDFLDYLKNLLKFFHVYSNTAFIQGQKVKPEYEELLNNLKIFIKNAEIALIKKPAELNIDKYYILRHFFKAKTEITQENHQILIFSTGIVLRELKSLKEIGLHKEKENEYKNNFNFSESQKKVLEHICQGTEYKRIAKELNLSESRIKGIAKEIREKFNVRTNAEAVNLYSNFN